MERPEVRLSEFCKSDSYIKESLDSGLMETYRIRDPKAKMTGEDP